MTTYGTGRYGTRGNVKQKCAIFHYQKKAKNSSWSVLVQSSVADPDPYDTERRSSWIRIRKKEGPIRILLSSSNMPKTVRKIPIIFWLLYDFLSLKNDVSVSSKSNKKQNLEFFFLVAVSCGTVRYRYKEDSDPEIYLIAI